jgi:hypothetical protein
LSSPQPGILVDAHRNKARFRTEFRPPKVKQNLTSVLAARVDILLCYKMLVIEGFFLVIDTSRNIPTQTVATAAIVSIRVHVF